MGCPVIQKDNLLFGIREKHDVFNSKLGEEELILNREAWSSITDRRCVLWMHFENGTKFLVEM